jgi:hypothetical protein
MNFVKSKVVQTTSGQEFHLQARIEERLRLFRDSKFLKTALEKLNNASSFSYNLNSDDRMFLLSIFASEMWSQQYLALFRCLSHTNSPANSPL